MSTSDIQYISDERGDVTGVIVPISVWNEIMSEIETHYLLKSETMKKRLLESRARDEGTVLEDVLRQLGIG